MSDKKTSKGRFLVVLIFCIIMMVVLKHGFIFFLAGMLPAIVAYIVDRSENHFQFKTVGAMNLAGVAPYLSSLVNQGNSSSAVQLAMADANAWLVMYSSAAFGWALVFFMPLFIRSAMEFFSDNKIQQLQEEQKELIEEWGEEVAGETNHDLNLASDEKNAEKQGS
jgi:hypothetical protein